MDTDDLEPVTKKPDIKNLEIMSVDALGEYIDTAEGSHALLANMLASNALMSALTKRSSGFTLL